MPHSKKLVFDGVVLPKFDEPLWREGGIRKTLETVHMIGLNHKEKDQIPVEKIQLKALQASWVPDIQEIEGIMFPPHLTESGLELSDFDDNGRRIFKEFTRGGDNSPEGMSCLYF